MGYFKHEGILRKRSEGGEFNRNMVGQENTLVFIGDRKQAVNRGPFSTADAGRGGGRI
jgi:hypothetical protein